MTSIITDEHYGSQHQETQTQENACSIDLNAPATWGPPNTWPDEAWSELYRLHEKGHDGSYFMRILGLNRRDKLENIFYHLSARIGKFLPIEWGTNYGNSNRRIPDLKMAKDELRITRTRLERLGLKVPQGTYVHAEKISDTELRLLLDL